MTTTTTLTAARKLQPGTVCVFPFDKKATVAAIRLGRTYAYIKWEESGLPDTRVELDQEFHVELSDMNASQTAAHLAQETAARVFAERTDYLEAFCGFTPSDKRGTTAYFFRLRSLRAAVRPDGSVVLRSGELWELELEQGIPRDLYRAIVDYAVKYSTEDAK